MSDQIPPADEFYLLRERMRADEARHAELRQLLLSDPSARTGNHYVAELREVAKSRTDYAEMKRCHPDLFEEFTFPATETHVVLREIDQETGEIISLRRKPKLHTIRVIPGGSAA